MDISLFFFSKIPFSLPWMLIYSFKDLRGNLSDSSGFMGASWTGDGFIVAFEHSCSHCEGTSSAKFCIYIPCLYFCYCDPILEKCFEYPQNAFAEPQRSYNINAFLFFFSNVRIVKLHVVMVDTGISKQEVRDSNPGSTIPMASPWQRFWRHIFSSQPGLEVQTAI